MTIPSKHILLASTLFVGITFLLIVFSEKPTASNSQETLSAATSGSLVDDSSSLVDLKGLPPEANASIQNFVDSDISAEESILAGGTPTPLVESSDVHTIEVKKGDTLSDIFQDAELSQLDLIEIEKACPDGWDLRRIDPGQRMEYQQGENGELLKFSYIRDHLTSLVFLRDNEGFVGEVVRKKVIAKESFHAVEIEKNQSVISAGLAAGVREEKTLWKIPKLLQWDIDFYHDIHPGDSFQILYYENYIDGVYYDDGDIIALIFENRGRTYEIMYFEADEVPAGYFERNGDSTKKRFLRMPVEYEYTRVSSEFNPKRLHPIHKVVMPHNGIDYAAPTGTSVRATGAGTVQRAGRTKANGNYVVIRHGPTYTTKYLHLHRIYAAIKPGAKVKQGQRIGSVGMTGYATGPHLHYEFLVNGVHKNPRTVELPGGIPLTEEQLVQFRVHADETFEHMNSLRAKYQEPEDPVANH